MVKSCIPSAEVEKKLTAVVLAAGLGSRMTEVLGNVITKCLVPVAGHPLIFYPLKSLKTSGYKEATVITGSDEEVQKAIIAIGDKIGISINIYAVDEEEVEFGTGQSLRIIAKDILGDILLLSCDSLFDTDLKDVVQYYKCQEADFVAVYLAPQESSTKLPGSSNKIKPSRDIIGTNNETNALVFMGTETDFDEDLVIPYSVLLSCPHMKIESGLIDSHVYVLSRSLLGALNDISLKPLSSLKGEILPALVRKQFETSTTLSKFKFRAYKNQNCRCIRVNSVTSLALANKCISWLQSVYSITFPPNEVSYKIAKGVKISKDAVIGDKCQIGEKASIENTILLTEVKVGKGSSIQQCIISSLAKIGEKCVLKGCLIGPSFVVPDNSSYTNENLIMMEDEYFES